MKLKIKLSLAFFIVLNIFSAQKSFSQCFQIESILVDACGPEEGYNEMVRFKVGNSPLNVSNLDVNWPTNALTWQGVAPNSLTTAKLATLNAGILAAGGCGKLLQPTGGVLPANSIVVLVTSYKLDITFNFFGAISEDIYIIFQDNDTTSGGHFGNYGTGGATDLRFLDMSFGSCSDSVEYNRTLLIDKDGNKKAGDGASVNYTPLGVATYVNIGCNAPVEVFEVNAGNSPISACQGATITLLGTAQGQQSVAWSDGSKGGIFSAQNSLNTTYTISPTTTGTITLTLTATNACNSTKTSTITLNVNSIVTPTFNPISTVCLNSTAPILPSSSTNVPPVIGIWDATINTGALGTTNYTFTPNAGQCASTATLPVTVDNCGFGTFASAAWLSNCNVPNGQFYNITGSGADLINPGSPAGSFITNLGTFIQNSGSLTFGGGEIKTFKSTIGNVCGATMFYNIHPQGIAAGTFAPLLLDFFSNCNSGSFTGGGSCSPRDQKWQTVNGGLVVDMTKFPSGNYVLEVYYTVNGDNNSSSQCDDTTILNNSGANYLSTFSIQGTPNYSSTNPSTCSGTEGTITISSLLANTNYTLSYKDDGVVVGPSSVTSNASGSIVISGLNAGTYSNFIVAADCGNYTNNSPIVLVNPTLSASISKIDNSVCQSTSVPCNGSATVVPSGSGSYSYLWNDILAQTSATASALCPGTYSVTITDLVSLCTLSRSITVGNTAVLPVLSSLSPVTSPICSGGNAVFTLSGTANASVTYSINGGVSQIVNIGTSGNTSVSVNQASSDVTIVLSQISLGSCSAALTNTATVIVSSPPNAGILNGLQTVCVNGTTTFSSTVNGGLWSSLDTSIATVDAFGVVTGISNGTATINYTVLGTGGCTSSAIATRTVTVSSSSVTITAGCVDTNYTLVASTSDTNVTYKWYKGATLLNETSNTLIVTQADTYKVIVNNGGCLSETTENVTFLYCDIPKGISPNNDQKNDFFDLTNFQVSKLEIFNRYGMKVYGKANYKKEWDGKTDSGQELPDATYYYVIEFESGKTKTGWVYINRQQ
ncbi:gliding motility-associated C-terminal domain-containing protein [Flavobacterium myungsuense]|uniref:Gliding motility-associated C-terminal domain-containing protein n=1 Tax=Flavobacterium myungsuense TaxID=651823 RepID=A0ABW3J5X7_9FLAO